MNEDRLDPLAPSIERALQTGWSLLPQIGQGRCDNALIWLGDGWSYVVTVPVRGRSTVVHLVGGPSRPGHPRQAGREEWRYRVPVDVALKWVLTGPSDDRELRDWSDR